ncbi:MAG: DUF4838 domain-containing protein [Armatimonadetes bacterium]|nr:DUF4838 domain-containing protein [Armatimonadota bacterium]
MAILMPFFGVPSVSGDGLPLVYRGNSGYPIVLPPDAIPAEEFAAEELASHLEQMSGVRLPVVRAPKTLPRRAILLGNSPYLRELGIGLNTADLGKEGYALRTVGHRLVIAGGRPRGTLYGVYALLEDYLGCRWYAPDTTFVPKRATIRLPRLNVVRQPGFEYREPWMYSGYIYSTWWSKHFVPEYVARTRNSGGLLHTHVHPIDDRHGGDFRIPHRGHNLSELVPAKEYATTHPEYFALHDGKRITEGDLELCLSYPDVVRIAADTMRRWMREAPEADLFFIGQSDTSNYCQCQQCVAAYRKHSTNPNGDPWGGLGWGGLAGRNLEFANEVATRLEKEFPHNRIGLFAYGATRNPPVNIQAHRNLVVWYCPIERCACHPLDRGPINHDFYNFAGGITTWLHIARQVYLYDYCHGNALGLPTDLLTLASTVRAAKALGVSGVEVDSIIDIQAGFGFCRYWLWTQLLRNPDFNAEKGLLEFLSAYYGAAAPHLEAFIRLASDPRRYDPLPDKMADIWTEKGSPARQQLVEGCHLGYRRLTREAIEEGYALFEKARKATVNDPKFRSHVEAVSMVIQYVMIEQLPADDPRLESQAASLFRMVEALAMPSVQGVPLAKYRQSIEDRIGGTKG